MPAVSENQPMTAPSIKEALTDLISLCERKLYPQPDKPNSDWTRVQAAKAALATLSPPAGDRREAIARTICQSGKFETGQGTCAAICMDQLGDVRKKGCGHCSRVHGKLADAILASGLVQDEAAIRKDEREKCAKIAEEKSVCLPHYDDLTRGYALGRGEAAAAIRSARDGGAES